MIEIITMDQIMSDYGLSRRQATKYLNRKGCPVLPRCKKQPYRVVRKEWERWLSEQRK
ncbi:MAG: hypothetical protein PHE79_05210 [Eubacteriales bacterium]|nr:hypothetical protein [Eubacteriales bacterium]